MPILKINRKNLDKFKPISPGVYTAIITEVEDERPSAKGDSINVPVHFQIAEGPCMGVEIIYYINSKGDFKLAELMVAIESLKDNDELFSNPEQQDVDIELGVLTGRQVQITVENQVYQGNLMNNIKSFHALEETIPF